MKKALLTTTLSIISIFAISCTKEADDHAQATDSHDHSDHGHSHGEPDAAHTAKVAGPNGGRIITSVTPHFEFFVTPERQVQIPFLDEANQAIAPAQQEISFIGGDRTAPTLLSFTKQNGVLLSTEKLTDLSTIPAMLQIKTNPTSETHREKFNLNFATCPGCSNAEYACICDHAH